ncbi:hypothetical protein ABPG74_005051 [Tetrahymena malaccensis]
MFNFFSSANINQNIPKYSVNDFVFRLKKIEKIVVKEGLDGFLLVNGVDSRENTEYVKLTNWLFLGNSGLEIEENEYLNQIYSDMIVLIKKGTTHIFIDPEALNSLQTLIYSIPNVDVFCPTEKQYEDKDEMELLKMAFFLRVMKPTKKVGILLGQKDKGKINSIEKWPLIQSYGLEELGVGFFSMNHEVVDLTQRLNAVYKNYDKFFVSKLIYVVAKRLTGHFNSAAGQLGDMKMHKRNLATESQLTEIFRDTYEIEEISKWVQIRGVNAALPKPRVLFGKNTSADCSKEPSVTPLKDLKYSETFHSFHATFETFDLRTCLRAARTYFLAKGVKEERNLITINDDEGVPQAYELNIDENQQYKDQDFLANLYLSIIIGFNEVMQLITKDYKNMTEEFIQDYIFQKVSKVYSGFQIPESEISLDKIQIILKAYNSFGEEVKIDFKDTISFKLTPYFFMIRIELKNIKSQVLNNVLLGSLVFAESFILQEGCYLLLTKEIPYFDLWNCQNDYSEKIEKMKKRILWEPLGKQISDELPKNRIFVQTGRKSNYGFDIPIMQASYYMHELGLRIETQRLGWFMLFFKEMKEIQITQKMNHTWLIFKVDSNITFNSISKDTIALEFTGNALEQSLFKIKNYLEENQIKYEYQVDIPAIFQESQIAKKQILNQQPQGQKLITMNSIQNEQFFISYIESKQLMILNQMKDLKLSAYKNLYEQMQSGLATTPVENHIGVILVNGSYCSGKRKFAENLIRFGSDNNLKLHLYKFDLNEMSELTEKSYLSGLLKFATEKKIQNTDVIVASVPHFINTKILIDYFSKSEKISNAFYIRTIATKININNIHSNFNKNPVNNVFTYGVEGYSQFLLLDTYNNYDADVNALNKTLSGVLPGAKIYKIMNNILNPALAKDILTSISFISEQNNLNRLKYSVQYDLLTSNGPSSVVFIPFKLPIFRDKIRDLIYKKIMQKGNQTLVDTTEAEQKIAEFKELNKNSKDPLMIEIIKLKEKIEIQNAQTSDQAIKIDYIKGILRYDGKLKEGLEEITITPYYFIERTVKGVDAKEFTEELNGVSFKNAKYTGITNSIMNDMGFLFAGKNLNKEKLLELLYKLVKPLNKQKLRQRSDLTEEEIVDIQFRNRGEGLENGEFYDGQFWRNIQGLILPHHPKKEELIEEYLKQEEERIKLINEQLQQEWETWKQVYDKIHQDK